METIAEEPLLNLWSPPQLSCRLNELKEIYFNEPVVSSISNVLRAVNCDLFLR